MMDVRREFVFWQFCAILMLRSMTQTMTVAVTGENWTRPGRMSLANTVVPRLKTGSVPMLELTGRLIVYLNLDRETED